MELQEVEDLRSKGYYVAIMDGAECKTKKGFINNIAKSFNFPSYYGQNLDALWECINDLEWIAELNYALVITNSKFFMSADVDNKQYIIEMLNEVVTEWGNVPNYEGEDMFRHKADFKVIYI
jgi:RNAse (barnase) inhibitor barstar